MFQDGEETLPAVNYCTRQGRMWLTVAGMEASLNTRLCSGPVARQTPGCDWSLRLDGYGRSKSKRDGSVVY